MMVACGSQRNVSVPTFVSFTFHVTVPMKATPVFLLTLPGATRCASWMLARSLTTIRYVPRRIALKDCPALVLSVIVNPGPTVSTSGVFAEIAAVGVGVGIGVGAGGGAAPTV